MMETLIAVLLLITLVSCVAWFCWFAIIAPTRPANQVDREIGHMTEWAKAMSTVDAEAEKLLAEEVKRRVANRLKDKPEILDELKTRLKDDEIVG